MSYEAFASVYDEIMDESLYLQWLNFTKRHLPKDAEKVLELAGGTGILAVELAEAGFQVTALDLSEEMLAIAFQRASQAEVPVQFIQGNMLDLSEIGRYDAVTCYSDSICYMQDQTQVQQVFHEVHQVLEDGGVFLFDVHSLYQMDEIFPAYSYHDQTEEFAFLWDSYPGVHPHSIEHCLTFFVKDGENDRFIRKDELHEERTYPLEEYGKMLENSGFSEVKVFSDFTDEVPNEKSRRWFFVCRK